MVIQTSNKQRGAVVISLSAIFLLLTTFVTLYVAKAILLEQKIMNNEMRSKLAFEAAEFGVTAAIDYISENPDRDGVDADGDGILDGDGNVDPIFTLVNNIGTTNISQVGTQSVEVNIRGLDLDGLAYEISSQGFSDDKSAKRTITQVIKRKEALPNTPDNPLTTRGTVDIDGSATVHNPEGNSTVWSGGDVDIGSNNATATYVADPSGAGYPGCMDIPMTCTTAQTSNKVTVGLDIIEHDNNLANLSAEQMFENFFGMHPDSYKDAMTDKTLAAGSDFTAGTHLSQSEIIWYDGPADISGVTVGCSSAVTGGNTCPVANEAPSIIIINGDVTMSGSPHFYGIVFVLGDVTLSGNSTFHGALIVAGETNGASGSLDVWYNSRLLEDVNNIPGFAAASGGWRDF